METPQRTGRRVAALGMASSAALAAWKIAAGVLGHSTAALSDGFESAGDVFTSGVVLFGLMQASRPPDEDHPYGHGRAETLAALFTGAVLIAAGVLICAHALEHLFARGPAPAGYAAWPLAVSIVVKTALWAAKRAQGKRLRSDALLADAANDLIDVLSASVALAGLGAALYDPAAFASLDHVAGFAVGLVVAGLGVRVVRRTVLNLMDTMPDEAMLRQIRAAALAEPGALGIEKCFARKTGLQYHVDLHLEVDPELTVRESHAIAARVKAAILRELDWVAGVLVHVEPHAPDTILGGGAQPGGAARVHGK